MIAQAPLPLYLFLRFLLKNVKNITIFKMDVLWWEKLLVFVVFFLFFIKKRTKNKTQKKTLVLKNLRHQKLNYEFRNCFTINCFTLYSCGWTTCNCITSQSWRKPLISAKLFKTSYAYRWLSSFHCIIFSIGHCYLCCTPWSSTL